MTFFHSKPHSKLRCAVLLCCLAALAHGQCTTSATLPGPGSNLACYSGSTGGGSTPANAPALGPSASGFDYCAAYSIYCSPSDQSAACTGQPSGTVVRVWVPLGAGTAQQMLNMSSVYMMPFICSTSGCNTVAASAKCTDGGGAGSITTLTSCGGSTCNVPATGGTGCGVINSGPIPLSGTCTAVTGGAVKGVPGSIANTATLQWYVTSGCSGSIAGTYTDLPLAGSPSTGCQATFFGSIYAAGSSTPITSSPSPSPGSAASASASAAGGTGRCTTSATLPAPGSNLACYTGSTGGGSTSANAPALGPSASGADYCAAYSIQCSPSDQSAACTGQPSGTVIRAWVPLGAATAQQMLTMPSVYMKPFICSTSGCNTVAAATCSDGKSSSATSSSMAWMALVAAALAVLMAI